MPMVDCHFRVQGKTLPGDHAFALYSALSRLVPDLHGNERVGIFPVTGNLGHDRLLYLTKNSRLICRFDAGLMPKFLRLAGKTLSVDGHSLTLGVPVPRLLRPSEVLYSRLVVIKGYTEPEGFLKAAREQLDRLGIRGTVELVEQADYPAVNQGRKGGTRSPYLRRTVRIHGREIVGFALKVSGLDKVASLTLQEVGLGGRRRFGCGLFVPYKVR